MNSNELKRYERKPEKEDSASSISEKKKEAARELLEVSDQLLFNEGVEFFSECKKSNELLTLRQKFMDWLFQVTKSLKIGVSTIYLTFNILDKILYKLKFDIPKDDIFFIGVISLSLATKFSELFKFRVKDMKQYLLHNKYTEKQIVQGEITILKIINFSVPQNHFENFTNSFFNQLWEVSNYGDTLKETKENIINLCLFYFKIVIMEYKLLRESKLTYLYMAIIAFCLAKYNDLTRNFPQCDALLKLSFMHLKSTSKVKKIIAVIELWSYSVLNSRSYKNISKEYKEIVMSFNKI